MKQTAKISLCQMRVENDKRRNIEKAVDMVETCASENADIVILPEMFNCPYDNTKFPDYAETAQGPTIESLSKVARDKGIYIVAGSIPEKDGEKLYNTCFIIGDDGGIIGRHRKLHLFDINIPGSIVFKESDVLAYGNEITVVDTKFGKIGVAICYDIRFPEIFRIMALRGADIIAVPAAFNMTTGPAHWELLMRARAVDNQLFIAAVSPARDENASYVAYGNSMVVDPWAGILVKAGQNEGIFYADLDLHEIGKVRSSLPISSHIRDDVYEVVLKKDNKSHRGLG